jgi:hypothetical protein
MQKYEGDTNLQSCWTWDARPSTALWTSAEHCTPATRESSCISVLALECATASAVMGPRAVHPLSRNRRTGPEFVCEGGGGVLWTPRNISIRIAGVPDGIRNKRFPSMSLERYGHACLLRPKQKKPHLWTELTNAMRSSEQPLSCLAFCRGGSCLPTACVSWNVGISRLTEHQWLSTIPELV